MSRQENREQKIRSNIRDVSLEDFEWLINRYGYIKSGARHALAIIANRVYAYKRTSPVRPPQVRKILELIDSL
jgi:hypothetical protein